MPDLNQKIRKWRENDKFKANQILTPEVWDDEDPSFLSKIYFN